MKSIRNRIHVLCQIHFSLLSLNSLQDKKEGRNGIKLISYPLFLAIPERSTVIKVGEALNERYQTKPTLVTAVGFNIF